MQFMQGSSANTQPLITPQEQTTVSKPGRAATFGNLFRALGKGFEAGADLGKGDWSGAEDAAKEHAGVDRLKRAFGKSTVTTQKTAMPMNTAPALYWGSMINQQQKQPGMM